MPDYNSNLVSDQASNYARWSPQEQLFYQIIQETFRQRELQRKLAEAQLQDEQGHENTPQQYAQGTSNVNNPGLRLFMAGQGLHRKKRKL